MVQIFSTHLYNLTPRQRSLRQYAAAAATYRLVRLFNHAFGTKIPQTFDALFLKESQDRNINPSDRFVKSNDMHVQYLTLRVKKVNFMLQASQPIPYTSVQITVQIHCDDTLFLLNENSIG